MAEKKILIVDDNPNMASLLAEMLEVFDVPSKASTDGETALRLLESEEFSLVITDLKMPNMSGVELLRAIKQKRHSLPVIVISGYHLASHEGKVVDGLPDGFINKPFKMTDIKSVLDQHL